MNVQPQLEELEDRLTPTAAELAALQQQVIPQLQVQFHAIVPIVQTTLQTDLNQMEALAPLFPAAFQPQLSAMFAQAQQFVNTFPTLANNWFHQTLANFEAQLIAASPPSSATTVALFAPGFFYPFFFPGFYGYPGVVPFGYGGVGFTSGFTIGSSGFTGGFSGGSGFGSDPPRQTGRGMGIGLLSLVGALTLLQSNPS